MHYILTGSYSGLEEKGIKVWAFDAASGVLKEISGISGIDRPSFLAIHPKARVFAATSETGDGKLVAYRYEPASGHLTEINRQPSNGDHPAHVTIEETGNWLLAVNYSGGNVNVYPLLDSGEIGPLADSVKHTGTGPNQDRQDAAHPHSISQIPGTSLFLVPDLGTDTIYAYQLDFSTGKLTLRQKVKTLPGSGPRHIAFHPSNELFFVLHELSSSLTVFRLGEGASLDALQTVQLLPDGWQGENTSAEVAVSKDGRFLYASNRGHDSIAVFSIDQGGHLESIGSAPSGGKGPRHFTLVPGGKWMIAANEKSDSLSILKIDSNGMPHLHGEPVNTKSPVCVKVIHG